MKKFLYLFVFMLAVFGAKASNYFTLDGVVNDTLRISPTNLDGYLINYVIANTDGYYDSWALTVIYPNALNIVNVDRGDDMYVPYKTSDGTDSICHAFLAVSPLNTEIPNTNSRYTILSSTITTFGYWDRYNNGNYETYGTVKWATGHYDQMARIDFRVNEDCTGDSIIMSVHITSTDDWRGVPTVNASVTRIIHLVVGYLPGDVNGDEMLTIADATALMSYVISQGDWFDQYQFAAADVNGDGVITIADVTMLTSMVLANGTASIEDINDSLSDLYDM